jgi:ankyrin repeat protein
MSVVEHGNTEAVKALIDRGTDLNARDDKGYAPLDYAEHGGYDDIVKLLRIAGAKK